MLKRVFSFTNYIFLMVVEFLQDHLVVIILLNQNCPPLDESIHTLVYLMPSKLQIIRKSIIVVLFAFLLTLFCIIIGFLVWFCFRIDSFMSYWRN